MARTRRSRKWRRSGRPLWNCGSRQLERRRRYGHLDLNGRSDRFRRRARGAHAAPPRARRGGMPLLRSARLLTDAPTLWFHRRADARTRGHAD